MAVRSHHFDYNNASNAPFFQLPKSPASVNSTPHIATENDYFSVSRKRQRPDSRDENHATQPSWTQTPSWTQCPTPSDGVYSSAYGQNSGIVNERYTLAGGFDTPSLQPTTKLEHLTVNENEFRRRLRDEDMGDTMRDENTPIFGPLARERNGLARMPSSPNERPQTSWTNLAFGIVGQVFSFGTSMIRGFYAGNGQGYDMNNSKYPLVGSDLLQQGAGRCSTPLPGAWHQDEFLGDFEQDSPAFVDAITSNGKPPNKRRQMDRDSWVLVGTPEVETLPSSPKRKTSNNSIPRSSQAQRPSASRASSRRNIAPMPRRVHSHVTASGSPQQQLSAPQPTSHARRASFAPTRSPHVRQSSSGNGLAYASPEAERYAKRQAKQDKAINSMGRRMEDLIRQAQEALGTKVSVEGDGMELEDEAFDDMW